MKHIINELFYSYLKKEENSDGINEIYIRLEKNKKNLKSRLNKKEKKILLRIIDDKDLIREESNMSNFVEGFKIGLKLGYESNKN